jgi:uncharacterized protein YciI
MTAGQKEADVATGKPTAEQHGQHAEAVKHIAEALRLDPFRRLMNMRLSLWAVGLLLCGALQLAGHQQPPIQQVYVALCERGPAWVEGKSVKEFPAFEQHLAHIHSIEPRLLGVGPFVGAAGETMAGMMVFFAASHDEALKVAESDPFVIGHYTRVTKVIRWQADGLKGCSGRDCRAGEDDCSDFRPT